MANKRQSGGANSNTTQETGCAIHRDLVALGHQLAQSEIGNAEIGPTTIRAIRAIERRALLPIDNATLLAPETLVEIERQLAVAGSRASLGEALVVEGTVRGRRGVPIGGLIVEAYDQDLRRRELLGRARTDRQGRYAVTYDPASFARAEKGFADLMLVVRSEDDPKGRGKVLYESPTKFNAPARLQLDIELNRAGPALYRRLLDVIEPLLAGQKLQLAEIDETDRHRDVSFLAAETGFAANEIAALAIAARLSAQTRLDRQMLFALVLSNIWVLPGSQDGILLGGLDEKVKALREQFAKASPATVRAALIEAEERGIAGFGPDQVGPLADAFCAFAARTGSGRMGGALPIAVLKRKLGKQAGLLKAHLGDAATGADLVGLVKADANLPEALVRKVEGLVKLSDLTLGDEHLVSRLGSEIADTGDVARLARRDASAWSRRIKPETLPDFAGAMSGSDAAKAESYARFVADRFAAAYPSQAWLGAAARKAPRDQSVRTLRALLEAEPEFDLGAISLDRYLARRESKRSAKERKAIAEQLKPLQRLYKLTSDFAAADALRRSGLGSGHAVYEAGEDQIVALLTAQAGLTERAAKLVHARASAVVATSLQLVGALASEADTGGTTVMRALSLSSGSTAPQFASLFNLGNDCACGSCSSVLSPAAYLTDLLMFLSRRSLGGGRSAKDVLLGRRPDLAWIDLNCDNAHVALPYVDLAIEAMSAMIAQPLVGALPASETSNLPSGSGISPVNAAIISRFANFGPSIVLSPQARVQKVGPDWLLRDTTRTFRLRPLGQIRAYELRNTHGTAAEREITPEYSNLFALNALAQKTFPWTLPLQRGGSTVSHAFELIGRSRADAMRELRGPNAPNNPSTLDFAAAELGISQGIAGLIANPAADPSAHWGSASVADAVARMTGVPDFLSAANLNYEQLLRLLALPYANLGGALSIKHLDETCDLDEKQILGWNAVGLDRVHRLLRLARSAGIEPFDADLLVRRFGTGGTLSNPNDLIAIVDALRVQRRIAGLSSEELAALFAAMPTDDVFVEAHAPLRPSLYASLFLDPRVQRPPNPAFAVAAVSQASPAAQIVDHRSAIMAALDLSGAELDLLAAQTGSNLSLVNLTAIFRHARIARALDLAVAEWLDFVRLFGADPFVSPARLLEALDLHERLRKLEFDLPALLNIVLGRSDVDGALASEAIAAALATLRGELQAIDLALATPANDAGRDQLLALLPHALAKVDPDSTRAARIFEIVEHRFQSETSISPVPAEQFVPSATLQDVPFVSLVDGTKRVLRFAGLMAPQTKALLLDPAHVGPIAANLDWQARIEELSLAPRVHLATVSTRYSVPLPTMPAGLTVPPALRARLRFDPRTLRLGFDGVMSLAERTTLLGLSGAAAWQTAIIALFGAPRANPVPADEQFVDFGTWQFPLDSDDESAADAKVRANLGALLLVLLPRANAEASRDAVVAAAAGLLERDRDTLRFMLENNTIGARSLLQVLTDRASFVALSTPIVPSSYAAQFQAFDLLHRIVRLTGALRMGLREVALVSTLATQAGSDLLAFSSLPLGYGAAAPAALSPNLTERLARLGELIVLDRRTVRRPVKLLELLEQIHTAPGTIAPGTVAGKLNLFTLLETALGWRASDVGVLAQQNSGLGMAYPNDFATAATWLRLDRAMALVRKSGLAAQDLLATMRPMPSDPDVQIAMNMLRARLGDQYAVARKKVEDRQRTFERDALKDYLLTYVRPGSTLPNGDLLPQSPTGQWREAADVFAYLLLDPGMGSCQLTSRIVQATIAIQLFVDRCFLGFEPEVTPKMAADTQWEHWKWMKSYRLWEANRKVFLFPEDYLEPELRRDKSFAFKEMEDELLQTELTQDSAREAFQNYIDKLDQVSNLDITGMYWENAKGSDSSNVHVVGRTPGQEPHAYFYRRFEQPAERWTAWSKIDIDLKSAPVLPFKYDRRTYLVWPEFREQKPPVGPTINVPASGGSSTNVAVAAPLIATGVALSEWRNGKWTPKKVSARFMSAVAESTNVQERLAWTPLDLRGFKPPYGGQFAFSDIDARIYLRAQTHYEFLGCQGYPEPGNNFYTVNTVRFERMNLLAARDRPDDGTPDKLIAIGSNTYGNGMKILDRLPESPRITYPHHLNAYDFNANYVTALIAAYYGLAYKSYERLPALNLITGAMAPFVFADLRKTFYVEPVFVANRNEIYSADWVLNYFNRELESRPESMEPWLRLAMEWAITEAKAVRLRFSTFYHPMVCDFREALLEGGLPKLLARKTQFLKGNLKFADRYAPVDAVVLRDDASGTNVYHPREEVDFNSRGAYSLYNWELFYHAPFLVGTHLMKAGRHEDAMGWFRHIFDPAGGDGIDPVGGGALAAGDPRRFWITKPFFEREAAGYESQRIDTIMRLLAARPGDPAVDTAARDALINKVATWRNNPFDPHLIAAGRDVAYQKAVYIKFVENLVAWGDKLFAANDVESVMAGGALYLYADSFMGPRPEVVPPVKKPVPRTYAELQLTLDSQGFGNAMVAVEDILPVLPPVGPPQSGPVLPSVMHFCLPRSEKLEKLRDLVEDRVGKFRNCLDLLGQPRKTALFAPPIDPAAAAAAMMAGGAAGDIVGGSAAPLPPYRFQTYLQKANELAGDLKASAGALLAALEKKDGEALAILRQNQEIRMLEASRAIKQAAIADAETVVGNLMLSQQSAKLRNTYYTSREFMNTGESVALGLNTASLVISAGAAVADTLGGVLAAIPNFNVGASGFGGTPHAAITTGGMSFSRALEMAAKALTQTAGIIDKTAGMVSTVAGYQRRFEDWQLQANVTAKEVEQYELQIAGARIRLDNVRRELANHEQQIENSKTLDIFMKSKYTNKELYGWLAGEIGKTFFETYKLAYAHAKLAERCYQFEFGIESSNLIGFGAWDSSRSGLQSGERLQLDLRRLEATYLAANRRSFELTKNVSLAIAAPMALLQLRRTGRCEVELPEELFDLDYPGHFARRIKSVAISIPCVTGSHTTVACTLRLVRNSIRTSSHLPGGAAGYPRRMQDGVPLEDGRFRDEAVPMTAIATSTGQNDSGMFELALRDERFLPFEGAGVVSRWSIEMVEDEALRTFDYQAIADAILHIRYTAREEGGAFKSAAIANLRNQLSAQQSRLELRRVFRVPSDMAAAWASFRNPVPGSAPELRLHFDPQQFAGPTDRTVKLLSAQLMVQYTGSGEDLEAEFIAPVTGSPAIRNVTVDSDDNRYGNGELFGFTKKKIPSNGMDWRLQLRVAGEPDFDGFDPKLVEDMYVIIGYTLEAPS